MRAGADFALSISDISGEMLSARLLGHIGRSRDEHRRVARVAIRSGSARTLREIAPRKHGVSVLAIERGGLFVAASADTVVETGDQLYVCGSEDAVKGAADLLV